MESTEQRIEKLEVSMREHQHTSIDSTTPLPPTTKLIQSVANSSSVTPRLGLIGTDLRVDIPSIGQPFTVQNPQGTPTNFQVLIIRVKDDGTGRAITWGSDYTSGGPALPTTTTAGKWLKLGFIYNSNISLWELVASAETP